MYIGRLTVNCSSRSSEMISFILRVGKKGMVWNKGEEKERKRILYPALFGNSLSEAIFLR